jgi:hypothetical protein
MHPQLMQRCLNNELPKFSATTYCADLKIEIKNNRILGVLSECPSFVTTARIWV